MSEFLSEQVDLILPDGPVRVYAGGPDDAPPVVLLHGAMLDTAALAWRHVGPELARDHRVLAVDWPRHGASRPWRGVVDQAALERVVDAVADLVGRPVALIGLSMGAGVSIGYALRRPDRVAAAVLSAPGGLEAVRPYQFLTWATTRSVAVLSLLSVVLARWPGLLERSLRTSLVAAEARPDYDRIVALAREEARAKAAGHEPALDDWQRLAYGPTRMRLSFLLSLGNLAVPTLWLRGDLDPLVRSDDLAAAVRMSPGATGATIGGAGHLAPLDQPSEFVRLVREFLAGTDLR